ncbi:MAG: hypothetical protein IPP49_21080 [Saprospiraceae bacterium]|nr:hypothetical protein [Saprospiraceae bacterium]
MVIIYIPEVWKEAIKKCIVIGGKGFQYHTYSPEPSDPTAWEGPLQTIAGEQRLQKSPQGHSPLT